MKPVKNREAASSPNPTENLDLQILVVDDDPIFRTLMLSAAEEKHVSVTVCASLREVEKLRRPGGFDIAVVDYYLDNLLETETGTEISFVTPSTPTILVSNTNKGIDDNLVWPPSIRKFIHKKLGADEILEQAIVLCRKGNGRR